MPESQIDLNELLGWEQDLPHPRWDFVQQLVASEDPANAHATWTELARQWLDILRVALPQGFAVQESERALLLSPLAERQGRTLLDFMAHVESGLLDLLPGIAQLNDWGKPVAMVLPNNELYYDYIAPFYGEGEFGQSAGVQIREGYPHVVLKGQRFEELEAVLAHEMTHLSLMHLTLPQWVEEGLTQTMEHSCSAQQPLLVDRELRDEHKRHWRRHSLQDFWFGDAFHSSRKAQKLAYQLAEILMRLLLEDHKPRWFGLVRGQQQRLLAFFKEATAADAGQSAAQARLGFGLEALAAKFLGPGEWTPIP
jgi:hypothetical protein